MGVHATADGQEMAKEPTIPDQSQSGVLSPDNTHLSLHGSAEKERQTTGRWYADWWYQKHISSCIAFSTVFAYVNAWHLNSAERLVHKPHTV